MKKILLILLLFISFLSFGEDDLAALSGTELNDPNLELGELWDWTIDREYLIFSTDGGTAGLEGVEKGGIWTRLPYYKYDSSEANINLTISKDYIPEYGWVFVGRDFGTQRNPVKYPLFMLYNRVRGLLRLFYYNVDDTHTHAIADMMGVGGTGGYGRTSLFTGNQGAEFRYLDNFDVTKKENSDGSFEAAWRYSYGMSSIHKIVPDAWSYVDFFLDYDPNIATDMDFSIEITGVDVSKILVNGEMTLKEYMIHKRVSVGLWDNLKSSAAVGGEYFNTGKDAAEFFGFDNVVYGGDKKKEEKKQAESESTNVDLRFIPEITTADIIGGAVSAGAFIYSLATGFHENQVVEAGYRGEITLQGTETKEVPLYEFLMRAPGSSEQNPHTAYKPFYDKALGVVAFNSAPKVAIMQDEYGDMFQGKESNDCQYFVTYSNYRVGLLYPVQYTINPSIGDNYRGNSFRVESVEASFVWQDKEINEFYNGVDGIDNFVPIEKLFSDSNIYNSPFYLKNAKNDKYGDSLSELDDLEFPSIAVKITIVANHKMYDENGVEKPITPIYIYKTLDPEYRFLTSLLSDSDDDYCSFGDNLQSSGNELCDPLQDDEDNDCFPGVYDNCPLTENHNQNDSDDDGIGDACDLCPNVYDPSQVDYDGNGLGDACDTVGLSSILPAITLLLL